MHLKRHFNVYISSTADRANDISYRGHFKLFIKGLFYVELSQKYWCFLDSPISVLDIPHSGDSDFHAKEVKDMINIVQRLIADGKRTLFEIIHKKM